MKRLFLAALLSLAVAGSASAATYNIDARHTQVLFTYSHFGLSNLVGRLNGVTGTFEFDAAQPAKSAIDVQIPISSLSTGVPKLDVHVTGPDMLDAGKFPTASFKSGKIIVLGKNHLSVAGELTIRGVTKPVTFDVTINKVEIDPVRKSAAAGFDASAVIKRSDFGVDFMLPKVADEVKLSISMEAREPSKEVPEAKKPG
jgi:polyisoprenoid-binding protein YceI